MKEGEPGRQKEHGEPFCACLYCQDQKLGLHKVETIDGVTEWLCGRHKRRADLTGLASYDLREPTEKDKKLADYIRGIIVKVPAIVTNPISEEVRKRLEDEKVEEWGWENLHSAEHRRQQIILVASHNQALVDVQDAWQECVRSVSVSGD